MLQVMLGSYGYGASEDNVGIELINSMIKLIYKSLPKEVGKAMLIEDFCWGSQFGDSDLIVDFNGEERNLNTPEKLWEFINFLVENRKLKEYQSKKEN